MLPDTPRRDHAYKSSAHAEASGDFDVRKSFGDQSTNVSDILLLKTAYAAGFVRATEIGNSTLRAMVKAQREPVVVSIGRG